MVCGSLRNSIPKSVVYCQVREAKRSLLDHFFTDLGKKEVRILINPNPSPFRYPSWEKKIKHCSNFLSTTFVFFFCSQNSWVNCWMRIQQSCSAGATLQKGWNYTEVPNKRLMQLLGPSRGEQIYVFPLKLVVIILSFMITYFSSIYLFILVQWRSARPWT